MMQKILAVFKEAAYTHLTTVVESESVKSELKLCKSMSGVLWTETE